MRKREAFEEAFTARTDSQQDFSGVGTTADALEQSFRFEAAAQFDRAMVADLQTLGESADRSGKSWGQPFQRKQRLMLLRLDAGGAGRILAEIQKAPDFVAESG